MQKVEFIKMHGAGNDYVYINTLKCEIADPSGLAIRVSDRHKGIGADGLVLIMPSEVADFRMRMFNADGSEGKMCGNASRCIAKYLFTYGFLTKREMTLETLAGIKTLHINGEGEDVDSISVEMGAPVFDCKEQFLPEQVSVLPAEFCGKFVSMGNPHYVVFVKSVADVDVAAVGSLMEVAGCFPEKANIEFAERLDDRNIRMRVWERGSGITMACGTGACATAVAAITQFGLPDTQTIHMDGGSVEICYKEGQVVMTGDATEVFTGVVNV